MFLIRWIEYRTSSLSS